MYSSASSSVISVSSEIEFIYSLVLYFYSPIMPICRYIIQAGSVSLCVGPQQANIITRQTDSDVQFKFSEPRAGQLFTLR